MNPLLNRQSAISDFTYSSSVDISVLLPSFTQALMTYCCVFCVSPSVQPHKLPPSFLNSLLFPPHLLPFRYSLLSLCFLAIPSVFNMLHNLFPIFHLQCLAHFNTHSSSVHCFSCVYPNWILERNMVCDHITLTEIYVVLSQSFC